jgi:Domain of unknown function (DUF4251)
MKQIKYCLLLLLTFLSVFIFIPRCPAQNSPESDAKKQSYKNMVDSQNFVFEAQTVTSLRGHFRNLTSPYEVSVSKDTLRSDLPFFGRAYNPPVNPTQSPLDFTSTNFSYMVSPHKKNGWEIVLAPKDKTSIQKYFFTVFDNGRATLSVNSVSRDPISFNGYIRERK